MKWTGPYTIDELLDSCMVPNHPRPPESDGVYLISEASWAGHPTPNCHPLYVGSNTGKSRRFRTRVGDLIADLFGFFGKTTSHHSGGKSLHVYCQRHGIHPKMLYIGWVEKCSCMRCTETAIYGEFRPILNRNKPSRCKKH